MAHMKGILFACLGAALVAFAAASFAGSEPGACAMPAAKHDHEGAPRLLLIF